MATEHASVPSMRVRVLLTAIYMFSERGFEATTMRAIAAAVGVKAPAIYNHFESKEDLLAEAVSWSMDDFVRIVVGPDDDVMGPSERLRGLIRRHVLYTIEHAQFATGNNLLADLDKLVQFMPEDSRDRVHRQMRDYLDLVSDLMAAALALPTVTPELRVTALSVMTMCDRVSFWYRSDGPMSAEQVSDHYWTLVGRMMGLPTG